MKGSIFTKKFRPGCFLFFVTVYVWNNGMAQEVSDTAPMVHVRYGSKGFELQTKDDKFLLQIQSRLQFRFATPGDQDPVTFDDYQAGRKPVFKINRARLKVGGHAF